MTVSDSRYSVSPRQREHGDRRLLHDLGNELGVALGTAELLSTTPALPEVARHDLDLIVEALSRAETLRGSLSLRTADAQDTIGLLRCQTAVLELIAKKAPLSATLAELARGMERQMPRTHCSILLLDQRADRLHHGAAPTLPGSYTSSIDGMSIGPMAGSCGTAAYTRRPVIVSDILVDAKWDAFRDLGQRHGLRSCWSLPILGPRSSNLLGTFALYHGTPHRPSEDERMVVERFTHLAAIAIEHHRLFNALHESEEQFRSAFSEAAIGMALTDPRGRLVHANAALCATLGYDLDELHSAFVGELLELEGTDELRAAVTELASGTRPSYVASHSYRHGDGTRRSATIMISPIKGPDNRTRYLNVQLRDITDSVRIEGERRAREVAERANLAKSEFVSRLSHELRTPLNAVIGFAELLQRGSRTFDATDCVRHILDAGTHMGRLIDDTVYMTQAEAGRLPLRLETLALAEVVAESVNLARPLAGQADVTLRTETGNGELVVADRLRLRQILLNLLTNAIKYNRPGGRVTVRTDAVDGLVRVTVEDTGRGLDRDTLDRVFAPFVRASGPGDDTPGSGLGLAIARQLASAMHGRMGADSEPGVGSRFWVDLPSTARETASTDSFTMLPDPREPAAQPVVLYLHGDRHSIDTVAGAQRLRPRIRLRCVHQLYGRVDELVQAERPDLVLLDLDGTSLSARLLDQFRRHPSTTGTPVVCLAAENEEAGAGPHVLRSPVDPDELLALLDRELPLSVRAELS